MVPPSGDFLLLINASGEYWIIKIARYVDIEIKNLD